jgi:hypothetical protein
VVAYLVNYMLPSIEIIMLEKKSLKKSNKRVSHLGTRTSTRSANFPGVMEPWVCPLLMDAAAFRVAAISASGMDMPKITQARCITMG